MPHLLIIDDDEGLRKLLGKYLTQAGFTVTLAEDPQKSDELLKLFVFDAMIMDVMMPVQNGIEYTKSLRQRGIQTPILMLTAMGQTSDRISGLESGADDYLSKPFDPKELLLRIKNLLKHQHTHQNVIYFGPFQYDVQKDLLTKNLLPVSLTVTEQQLLQALIQAPDGILSREDLVQKLHMNLDRTIDVQMARLRRKLEDNPKHPVWIQTVRGKGYKLVKG